MELESADLVDDAAAFAFGGLSPGTLHAHGELPETHKCLYSVGRAGQYLLHVRLRKQAVAIRGSPFTLTIHSGPAYATSTSLPPLIEGGVGGECSILMQAC